MLYYKIKEQGLILFFFLKMPHDKCQND